MRMQCFDKFNPVSQKTPVDPRMLWQEVPQPTLNRRTPSCPATLDQFKPGPPRQEGIFDPKLLCFSCH